MSLGLRDEIPPSGPTTNAAERAEAAALRKAGEEAAASDGYPTLP